MNRSNPIGLPGTAPSRKVLRCRAQLQFADGNAADVRTVDVTAGGMSVMAQHHLAVGSLGSLVFELPANGALQILKADVKIVYATLVGTEGVRLGLRFMSTDLLRTRLIDALH